MEYPVPFTGRVFKAVFVSHISCCAGPLGQGICNAVGIAAAEEHLAARFNKPDMEKVIDHYTCVHIFHIAIEPQFIVRSPCHNVLNASAAPDKARFQHIS